jgi:hypothetical protein
MPPLYPPNNFPQPNSPQKQNEPPKRFALRDPEAIQFYYTLSGFPLRVTFTLPDPTLTLAPSEKGVQTELCTASGTTFREDFRSATARERDAPPAGEDSRAERSVVLRAVLSKLLAQEFFDLLRMRLAF